MKNLLFICIILIVLFKTGNVFSNSQIFTVNNIAINKKTYENKDNFANKVFKKGFKKLIERHLLEEDYKKFSSTNLQEIKKLISYYQIITPNETALDKDIKVNLLFDKEKMHNFFYQRNILYSDIINTEIIIFPLLIKDEEFFIYSKNHFYKNWNTKDSDDIIEYILPLENIENIQKIDLIKENIIKIDISDFFKEYDKNNLAFIIIQIKNKSAKIILNTKISKNQFIKNISIDKGILNEKQFNDKIILETKNKIRDLIKSENLIDVRTPSFLNVEIKLNNKSNLVEFKKRVEKIDLIDNFYIQQLNKDYAIVKIKYLGKINKIINKLKDQNINLKMQQGQWRLKIT
tara:strand:- start:1078 stop:2118 length:1041 start_codon:yes stop_codon:yes gene_type:complete